MTKSNLAIRLSTAAVVVPLLLLLLFVGPVWGWYALVLGATGVAAYELFSMTCPDDAVARAAGTATTVAFSLMMYFGAGDARLLVTAVLAVAIVGGLIPLWRLGRIETAALRVFAHIAGPVYVGGLLCTLALLRRDLGAVGPHYVLFTLLLAWLGDTGGYFFGRVWGKRKLYEAVSPKKTVAGLVGAVAGALVATLLGSLWFLRAMPVAAAVVLALLAGIAGQLGDLVESLVKRSTGVKDSGAIIPGHGGLLDRIDAVLFVAPLVYLYAVWFGPTAGGG